MRNFIVIFIFIFFVNNQSYSQELKKTYFGGGCFWCMEESFDKVEGVTNVVSGYSGGTKPNPTYKEVTYGDTGHIEVVEITYDTNKISYEELLNVFWKNIDPFDAAGQFCDKGYSYKSAAFYPLAISTNVGRRSIRLVRAVSRCSFFISGPFAIIGTRTEASKGLNLYHIPRSPIISP